MKPGIMPLTHADSQSENDRRDRPVSVSMILAEQVLGLFEQSGATSREQEAAIDIVRTVVMERVYEAISGRSRSRR